MKEHQASERGGVVYVTLKKYLAHLESLEGTKPASLRREVPSMAALARAAGIHPMTMSRWVQGDTGATNHQMVSTIIDELRARGFNTDVSDILAYRSPSEREDM